MAVKTEYGSRESPQSAGKWHCVDQLEREKETKEKLGSKKRWKTKRKLKKSQKRKQKKEDERLVRPHWPQLNHRTSCTQLQAITLHPIILAGLLHSTHEMKPPPSKFQLTSIIQFTDCSFSLLRNHWMKWANRHWQPFQRHFPLSRCGFFLHSCPSAGYY